ncbi:hypothetical protein ACFVIM_00690 [Streptomyces sp. NPDC057638]|uniref:hypothetical protein n=1 Tax=Streptomyces sp. NPDC057638 TaxID=3346190 RepID=UPI00367FC55B
MTRAPLPPTPEVSPDDDPNESTKGSLTQEDLTRLLAREKSQGGRTAVKKLLEGLGFADADALNAFVTTKRDADQAALTEIERREQAAEEKLKAAEAREVEAALRERTAIRRSALAGLGAAGDGLEYAMFLIDKELKDEAETGEDAVTAAAESLAERRPDLFSPPREATPPAPGGSPAGGPPPRGGVPPKPGAAGLDMARRRGHITN